VKREECVVESVTAFVIATEYCSQSSNKRRSEDVKFLETEKPRSRCTATINE
jgi:hypothetical protein